MRALSRNCPAKPVTFPEDGYHGAYITALAERIKPQLERECPDVSSAQSSRNAAGPWPIKNCWVLFARISNHSGSSSSPGSAKPLCCRLNAVERVLDELKSRHLVFEQEGAWWFRSSAFGDEKDRVVKKQDGEYTYLASDIAYHRDKLQRGYDLLIDVWGADHHGYIPRMQAVMQAYGHPKDRLQVVLVQIVNLLRAGEEVKMSKRTGEFITMREVIDEVGADAAKFYFLMRDSKTRIWTLIWNWPSSGRRIIPSTMCSMPMPGSPASGESPLRAASPVPCRARRICRY